MGADLVPYIITGGASAAASVAGSYAAVWAHLKFHDWRLNQNKDDLETAVKVLTDHEKRLTILEYSK